MSTDLQKQIIQVGLIQTAEGLKAENFLWLVTEEEVRAVQRTKGI